MVLGWDDEEDLLPLPFHTGPHPPAPSPAAAGEGGMSFQEAIYPPLPRAGEGLGVRVVRRHTVMYLRTLSQAEIWHPDP